MDFDKITFLFGAGVSVGPGCKTSKRILEDLKPSISKIGIGGDKHKDYIEYKEAFKEVLEFIMASLHYQDTYRNYKIGSDSYYAPNIEDFMLLLRKLEHKDLLVPSPIVGNWSNKILRWEIKFGEGIIFKKFIEFITIKFKEDWLKFDPLLARIMLTPLSDFIETSSSKNTNLNLFTLNYDLIFETTLNSSGETVLNNGFTKNGFSVDNFNSQENRIINYYKLHGSLDWYQEDSEEIKCDVIKHEIQDDPIIILGEPNKMMSFDPFLSLLYKFKEQLEKSSLIIAIGYGFQDVYINNLILQSLNSKSNKKLIIVSPSAEKTEFMKNLIITQKAKQFSSMNNICVINENKLDTLNINAQDFFFKYFKDGGKELLKELEEEDNPF